MDLPGGHLDMDVEDAIHTLTSKPTFRGITATDLVPVVKRGVRRTFPAGSFLMEHGRHSNCLHLLLRGRARVEQTFGLDRPRLVAEIGAGDLVGEMGSFSGTARSATVKAIDEVESLELSETALKSVLRHDHPLMVALLRMMNERYKNL